MPQQLEIYRNVQAVQPGNFFSVTTLFDIWKHHECTSNNIFLFLDSRATNFIKTIFSLFYFGFLLFSFIYLS